MPGIATHFKILDLTIQKLSGGNAQQQQIANVMKNNKPWAYLGAVGPALADFIPSAPPKPDITSSPADPGGNFYSAIWKGVFTIMGGDGTPANPGMLNIIQTFDNFFNAIQPILDDEDLSGLSDMKDSGQIDTITAMASALKTLITTITSPAGFLSTIEDQIGKGMYPIINKPAASSPESWTAREYLFWQKSGDFARALLDSAESSGDQTFLAYAYGYVSGYAGFVAGSSFTNSVIQGTYRSDWWRYRWIDNFIDAWVYGFYNTGATMAGDTPTPAYADWPGLCSASLHKNIALPGLDLTNALNNLSNMPQVISSEFNAYWFGAFEKVYGPRPANTRFQNGSLDGAYIMTYLVLWFQTSGQIVGCNPPPPMQPPAGADPQPSWADPTNPGSNGEGSVPPDPSVEKDPDVGEIICGAILALLGLVSLCTGGLITGGVAIGVGVDLIITGASEINWTKLRSDIYWYRMYFYNGLKSLHQALVLGALQHPYPSVLDTGDALTLLGFQFTYDSAAVNCKSTSGNDKQRFPPIPWEGNVLIDGLWISAPSRSVEEPGTLVYRTGGMYPDFFINDDTNNPLSKGHIRTGTPVHAASDGGNLVADTTVAGGFAPIQFGNVVANAVDLYASKLFPNWNLDSDRGLAYLDWKLKAGWTNPMAIQPA
jgi:hypothetical protein